MKKTLLGLLLLPSLFLASCMKDSYRNAHTYTYLEPIYKTTAEVRAGIKSNAPQTVVHPGKIYIKDQYIFLNDVDKGIHIIDNTDPAHPQNMAFIDIPGNVDIAVKGNTLYADFYTDLVVMDISNPAQVAVKKIIDNVFPERYYGNFRPDSSKVIASWVSRDTTVFEESENNGFLGRRDIYVQFASNGSPLASKAPSAVGIAGSMARFAIAHDHLYTVGTANLNIFDLGVADNPAWVKKDFNLGRMVETIFPFKDKLFIGTNTGVLVYNINSPASPALTGAFNHVTSCDPVIADDDFAFATLRTGTTCNRGVNTLDVLRISSILSPTLVKSYPLTNPHGLSKDGHLLFVCDGSNGLLVFNAIDPANLVLLNKAPLKETFDVIAFGGIALVVSADGIYQYRYGNLGSLELLSQITIQK